MKYCTRCGRALSDYSSFCGFCGQRQPDYRAPVIAPLAASALVPKAPPTQALVPTDYPPTPPDRLRGEIPLLILSLILVPLINPVGTPLAVLAALFCLFADAHAGGGNFARASLALRRAAALCVTAALFDLVTLILLLTGVFRL